MKRCGAVVYCLSLFFVIAGCSVSEKTLINGEKRIAALQSKGAPDTLLSKPKVFLYQAREAKRVDDKKLSRVSADSMKYYLNKAEREYKEAIARIKPWMDKTHAKINNEMAQLKGLNRQQADSLLQVVEASLKKDWLMEAEGHMKILEQAMPRFILNEKLADEIKSQIPGTWTCTEVTKHETDKTVNATAKKIFTFNTDGSGSLVENKKGKSSPLLKEDYEFVSNGKWDVKGDTIFLMVDRFQAKKLDFWNYKTQENGRKEWIKDQHATYDSTIVDRSQDRYIAWKDLTMDFKKGR